MPMKCLSQLKCVADKHEVNLPKDVVCLPVHDLHSRLPRGVQVTVVRVALIATVPKQVVSIPRRDMTTDVTSDCTLPRSFLKCPMCKNTEARVIISDWSDKTLTIWSQCSACNTAFEVINAPDLPENSTFYEGVLDKDAVISAAQNTWCRGLMFPFVCSLEVRVQGKEDPEKFTDIHCRDIDKLVIEPLSTQARG